MNQSALQGLVPHKVSIHAVEQLGHRRRPAREDMLLDGGKGVRRRSEPDALNVGRRVTGARVVVVLTALDAVFYEDRKERRRHPLGEEAFDTAVPLDFQI